MARGFAPRALRRTFALEPGVGGRLLHAADGHGTGLRRRPHRGLGAAPTACVHVATAELRADQVTRVEIVFEPVADGTRVSSPTTAGTASRQPIRRATGSSGASSWCSKAGGGATSSPPRNAGAERSHALRNHGRPFNEPEPRRPVPLHPGRGAPSTSTSRRSAPSRSWRGSPTRPAASGTRRSGSATRSIYIADEHPEIRLREPPEPRRRHVQFVVNVPDVDAMVTRAVAAGGALTRPVADRFYGDRNGEVTDPFGYRWTLSTRVEDSPTTRCSGAGRWRRSGGRRPAARAEVGSARAGPHSMRRRYALNQDTCRGGRRGPLRLSRRSRPGARARRSRHHEPERRGREEELGAAVLGARLGEALGVDVVDEGEAEERDGEVHAHPEARVAARPLVHHVPRDGRDVPRAEPLEQDR